MEAKSPIKDNHTEDGGREGGEESFYTSSAFVFSADSSFSSSVLQIRSALHKEASKAIYTTHTHTRQWKQQIAASGLSAGIM